MLKKLLVPGLILMLLAGSLPLAQAQEVRKAQAIAASPTPAPGGVGVALRDGDSVEIRIANVPAEDMQQFDGTYTLDEVGNINLPYIGLVAAGGVPPSQVQTMIQNKLISAGIYTMPTVTVTPPAGARFISVTGAVKGPNRVPYSSDLTLMTAISAVGGPSDFAGDTIRLIRKGKVQKFSRKRLDKDPSKDPPVEPGDQIEVMQSLF